MCTTRATAALAACVALTGFARAASADESRAYAAMSETDTASGVVATRDVLVLRSSRTGTSLSVVRANVASDPVPVTFAADGEIVGEPLDASETCYNMAVVVDHAIRARVPGPVTLYFGFADRAVPITFPLSVRATGTALEIAGAGQTDVPLQTQTAATTGNVGMTAHVESANGSIERASFVEITSIGGVAHPVSRTTCALTSIPVAVSS